jgi:hypothetical protein
MRDDAWTQVSTVVVIVGCLGVAMSVVSLGMGFVNIMSADAGTSLSAFSVTRQKVAPPGGFSSAPAAAPRLTDINYLREEIAAREDQIAVLRREAGFRSKELNIQQKLRDQLAEARNANATDADGSDAHGTAADTRPIALEIAKLDTQITQLRKQSEDAARVDVTKLIQVDKSGEKPRWAECQKDGVVLQPQATAFPLAGLNTSDALVAALNSPRVVLLVRPSGFESCAAAMKALDDHQIAYDMVPVDEQWQLIFH